MIAVNKAIMSWYQQLMKVRLSFSEDQRTNGIAEETFFPSCSPLEKKKRWREKEWVAKLASARWKLICLACSVLFSILFFLSRGKHKPRISSCLFFQQTWHVSWLLGAFLNVRIRCKLDFHDLSHQQRLHSPKRIWWVDVKLYWWFSNNVPANPQIPWKVLERQSKRQKGSIVVKGPGCNLPLTIIISKRSTGVLLCFAYSEST